MTDLLLQTITARTNTIYNINSKREEEEEEEN